MESSRFPSRFATPTRPPKPKGFTERRCPYCWLMMKKFATITWIRARFQRLWRGGCEASLNPRQGKPALVLACNVLVSRAISLATGLSGRGALFFLSISAGGITVWLSSAVRDGMGPMVCRCWCISMVGVKRVTHSSAQGMTDPSKA